LGRTTWTLPPKLTTFGGSARRLGGLRRRRLAVGERERLRVPLFGLAWLVRGRRGIVRARCRVRNATTASSVARGQPLTAVVAALCQALCSRALRHGFS